MLKEKEPRSKAQQEFMNTIQEIEGMVERKEFYELIAWS